MPRLQVEGDVKPRLKPVATWGGQSLPTRHWLCWGQGGRWGFGATPREAYRRWQSSCQHFTDMGAD